MGRKPRSIGESGCCHVTARGNNRQQVFQAERDFLAYRDFLRKYGARYGVAIHHYCFMTNHVHLMLRTDSSEALGKFMHGVQRSYFLLRQRSEGLSGHLWETPYGCSPIEKESYLLECARYVERNPIEAGLAKNPEDYRWSSYRCYAYGTEDPLVTFSPLYQSLGTTPQQRQGAYRTYVSSERLPKLNLNRYDVPKTV